MYSLYETHCLEINEGSVKESFYREISCSKFNLHFHSPRKDRCDLCEEMKIKEHEGILNNHEFASLERHKAEKDAARAKIKMDKESETPCLVFDLQNVLMLRSATSSIKVTLMLTI